MVTLEAPENAEEGAGATAAGTEPETPSIEVQKQELEKEREKLRREYLRFDTIQLLKECGLPEILAEHVMGSDLDETRGTVQHIKAAFDEAVQKQVEKRLVGKTPQCGNESSYMGDSLSEQVRRSLA